MPQTVTEPVVEPEATERVDVSTPNETPGPEPKDDDNGSPPDARDDSIRRIVAATKRLSSLCFQEIADNLEETTSKLGMSEPDGNGAPKGKTILNSPRWKLYNVLCGLDHDVHRLQAASTVIACGEPDASNPMDGSEACAVENIVDRVIERLDGHRKVIAEVSREIDLREPTVVSNQPGDEPAPTNGLPEWSDERWPTFQRVVAALPGIQDGSRMGELIGALVDAVDETMMNVTDNAARLMPLANLIKELGTSKGAAA